MKRRRSKSPSESPKKHAPDWPTRSGATPDSLTHPHSDETDHVAEDQEHTDTCQQSWASRDWLFWGPYLSERQWATVREDYSEDGNCWAHFPHRQAPYRAYQSGEDGLLGICDHKARLCLSLALWNGKDTILKERLFGLTGPEGVHGEDVKELYFYLDSSPTHDYMRALYKYPQNAFPYDELRDKSAEGQVSETEYELTDTGIFDSGEYWDIEVEYAKPTPYDVHVRYTVSNRADHQATLHLIPTLCFRNTVSWDTHKPSMKAVDASTVKCEHKDSGMYEFTTYPMKDEKTEKGADLVFMENSTNFPRLFGSATGTPGHKDAAHQYVIHGQSQAVNDRKCGTKCAAIYVLTVEPKGQAVVDCRLVTASITKISWTSLMRDKLFARKREDTDAFYSKCPLTSHPSFNEEQRQVARQAAAGLLWSKQYYYYHVDRWLRDSCNPGGRINQDWRHVYCDDIVSMPDKWEFPWFATWDLAFHMIPMADLDLEFCQGQLLLLLSDKYMHPNGQLPAYEFNFSDANPPVHAWACLEVFRKSQTSDCHGDRDFLRTCFNRLLINFTWWMNTKSIAGEPYLFSGGFLGLDNISALERSHPPDGVTIIQADGTGWMAFYCVCMLQMALVLAETDAAMYDIAGRFLHMYCHIATALKRLWNVEDGFFYDHVLHAGSEQPLCIQSLVGIVPLFASCHLDAELLRKHPQFAEKLTVTMEQWKDKNEDWPVIHSTSSGLLLCPLRGDNLTRVLNRVFNEKEFLSKFGVRSLSKVHTKPYLIELSGQLHRAQYWPGESESGMYGGNSNWRGPVWICMNYLLTVTLQSLGSALPEVKVILGSRSELSQSLSLHEAFREAARRVCSLFYRDTKGRRPVHGTVRQYAENEHWQYLLQFYEYYHGETGRGLGASHQTGWSALVANLQRLMYE